MKRLKGLRKSGLDKHEIYAIACSEGLDKKKAAKYLASYPDPEDLEKLKGHRIFFSIIFIALKILYPAYIIIYLSTDLKSTIQTLVILLSLNALILWLLWIGSKWGFGIFAGLQIGPIVRAIEDFQSVDILLFSSVVLLLVYSAYIKWLLYPYQDLGHSTKRREDETHIFTDKPRTT